MPGRPDRQTYLPALAWLIVLTLCARLAFGSLLGLGIDESYMVAAGRHWRAGYYDHPPIAWWLAWAAAHLAGSEAPIVVRLPFIALFSLSTWLMFGFARALFGEAAGFWAAFLLNMAPVFGITTASWVLPDGPLIAALLAGAWCLARAVAAPGGWRWWLGAGAGAGLALDSKYTAILTLVGAGLFVATAVPRWLTRPQPYAAAALALLLFAPVLGWNARHGWVSFAFQGGRANGHGLQPWGLLSVLAGEAIFLLPWIMVPLLVLAWRAARRGPADRSSWLAVCLGLPPVLVFAILSLWTHVLFHWAAPGFLMLLPLLGAAVARHHATRSGLRAGLAATAAAVLAGAALTGAQVRTNWLAPITARLFPGVDPGFDAVDWTALRTRLAADGWLARPGVAVAALRWHDAGKIDYALGGAVPVICLGDDPRQYGMVSVPRYDVLLVIGPRIELDQVRRAVGAEFRTIAALPPLLLYHAGEPALTLRVFLVRR